MLAILLLLGVERLIQLFIVVWSWPPFERNYIGHSGSPDREGSGKGKANAVLNLAQLLLQCHLATHYVGQPNV